MKYYHNLNFSTSPKEASIFTDSIILPAWSSHRLNLKVFRHWVKCHAQHFGCPQYQEQMEPEAAGQSSHEQTRLQFYLVEGNGRAKRVQGRSQAQSTLLLAHQA